ncbi:MAG: HyaD/HybD family hydrogenase maturation endopeptidase [Candidatus Aquicultorales bacterium]
MSDKRRIIVLGVGNTILTDEGVGVRAVMELGELEWPENVEFLDGGTAGYDLIHMIEVADKLIIVDAVDARSEPGTVYRFVPEDVMSREKDPTRFSLHEVGLIEALTLARFTGNDCEMVIFGIQPKSLDWGTELTPELEEKLPRLKELVAEEIRASLEQEG